MPLGPWYWWCECCGAESEPFEELEEALGGADRHAYVHIVVRRKE